MIDGLTDTGWLNAFLASLTIFAGLPWSMAQRRLFSPSGAAGAIVRRSVPQIFASFFPSRAAPVPATKPTVAVLFVAIAMDDVLSGTDLGLLAQLQSQLLVLGLCRKANAVFVLSPKDEPAQVVGYYTLCATAISQGEVPEATRKHVPRYPMVSSTLIGRLAVG